MTLNLYYILSELKDTARPAQIKTNYQIFDTYIISILVCCVSDNFKKALAPIFMALKSKIHLSATIEAWNNLEISKCVVVSFVSPIPRIKDTQWSLLSSKYKTFGFGKTIWATKFWGIWGIFGLFISPHFGTVNPMHPCFLFDQPIFPQKIKPL